MNSKSSTIFYRNASHNHPHILVQQTNQFMQVYWNAYNSTNITGEDDHEAACCKAIAFCMDNGATKRDLLKLVDTKAPMAVWERDGKYAVRTVGEVNREREAANKSSTDRSR